MAGTIHIKVITQAQGTKAVIEVQGNVVSEVLEALKRIQKQLKEGGK